LVLEAVMRAPASWVIVDLATGQSVAEITSATLAAKVNKAKYKAVPIIEYLSGEWPIPGVYSASYRYRGRFGYYMVVAKNPADALKEAAKSISGPIDAGRFEVWAKDHWEKVS
jgi:hypothetical protein